MICYSDAADCMSTVNADTQAVFLLFPLGHCDITAQMFGLSPLASQKNNTAQNNLPESCSEYAFALTHKHTLRYAALAAAATA